MSDENARVTNLLLQKDLEVITKKLDVLPEMKNQLHDIDTRTAVVCKEVERNKEEIDSLRKRGNINDAILAVSTVVMGTISSILGTRQ